MTVFPCAGGTYHDSHQYAIVARILPENGAEPGQFTLVATLGPSSAAICDHILLRIADKIRRRLPAGVKLQIAVVYGCPKYFYDVLSAKRDALPPAKGELFVAVSPDPYDLFNFEVYNPQGKHVSRVVTAADRFIYFTGTSDKDGFVVFTLGGSAGSEVMLDLLVKTHMHLNPDALVVKRVGFKTIKEPV